MTPAEPQARAIAVDEYTSVFDNSGKELGLGLRVLESDDVHSAPGHIRELCLKVDRAVQAWIRESHEEIYVAGGRIGSARGRSEEEGHSHVGLRSEGLT